MLKMSQTELGESLKALEDDEEPEKHEVRVSESKKVRLEAVGDATLSFPSGRPGDSALEADNKWLSNELKAIRETKEHLESKVEKLENERVRLELELGNDVDDDQFATLNCEFLIKHPCVDAFVKLCAVMLLSFYFFYEARNY